MNYVKERKLIYASKEIFKGRKIIEIAEEYGYETHSGFSKVFKKKFGFTPTQHLIYAINMIGYLNNENSEDDFMKNEIESANVFMKSTVDFRDKEILYKELIKNIETKYTTDDIKNIEKAYQLACRAHQGQYRKSKEEYITHSLCVSLILSQLDVGKECIIVGLLHDIIFQNTPYTLDEIRVDFSDEVAELINQVTKFENINTTQEDIDSRVILIKLADRLHNMRTIKYMEPERCREKAKETIEIFSPIAAKYNIIKLKAELDDLSWRILK